MVGRYGGWRARPCRPWRSPHNLHRGPTGPTRLPLHRATPPSAPGAELLQAAFEVGDEIGQGADVGPLPVPVGDGRSRGAGPAAAPGVARGRPSRGASD